MCHCSFNELYTGTQPLRCSTISILDKHNIKNITLATTQIPTVSCVNKFLVVYQFFIRIFQLLPNIVLIIEFVMTRSKISKCLETCTFVFSRFCDCLNDWQNNYTQYTWVDLYRKGNQYPCWQPCECCAGGFKLELQGIGARAAGLYVEGLMGR